MNSAIVDPTLQKYKSVITQLLIEIEQFAQSVDNTPLIKTIQNLQENINQPFLFVVIGEVKAGKSSFINAMLGSGEICEVGADPRTNIVAKVVYAEGDGYNREVKPGKLCEIGRPVPILKQVTIVDTPGTNSPFQQHEDITKEFIPNSDLVVFVFFSKNPYTNTAWSLVDFANREWKKPVIFVLQQADLSDNRELKTSAQYIQQEAKRRQIHNPQIFATSAKQAAEQAGHGGFEDIRSFVRDTITGGKGYQLKLSSNITAAEQIVERLGRDIEGIKRQLEIDEEEVAKIRRRLGQGQLRSLDEVSALVERLMAQYERIIYQIKSEFREELSILTLVKRSVLSLFNREQRIEAWISNLKVRAQKELDSTLDQTSKDGAKRFLDSVQLLIHQLNMALTNLQNDTLRHSGQNSNIELLTVEDRYEVIEGVKSKISNLMDDEAFINCLTDTADSVGPGVAGGSLLAMLGGVIAAVTRIAFLDVLGSVFLGVGVLFAGGVLVIKRRGLIQKMDEELDRNRDNFEAMVSEQLTSKLSVIYEEINRSFAELYAYVEQERVSVSPLLQEFDKIQQKTQALSHEIRKS